MNGTVFSLVDLVEGAKLRTREAKVRLAKQININLKGGIHVPHPTPHIGLSGLRAFEEVANNVAPVPIV